MHCENYPEVETLASKKPQREHCGNWKESRDINSNKVKYLVNFFSASISTVQCFTFKFFISFKILSE